MDKLGSAKHRTKLYFKNTTTWKDPGFVAVLISELTANLVKQVTNSTFALWPLLPFSKNAKDSYLLYSRRQTNIIT
jgi:hypothetical protein